MQLSGLVDILKGSHNFTQITRQLQQRSGLVGFNVIRSARPYVTAALASEWKGPIIYVTAEIRRAYNIAEQLPVWLGAHYNILRFSEPTPQFYERVPWGEQVIRSRLEVLAALMDDEADTQPLVVTSARALMQRTMPPHLFRRRTMNLKPGDRWQVDKLLETASQLGYTGAPIVTEPGMFSRRGGVIDIFPIANLLPVRIEFFGDEIESLRQFDPATQRSTMRLNSIMITPAREVLPDMTPGIARQLDEWFKSLPPASDDMTRPASDAHYLSLEQTFGYLEHYLPYAYPDPVSLLDYAPEEALVIIDDEAALQDVIESLEESAAGNKEQAINQRELAPSHPSPFVGWDTLREALYARQVLHFSHGEDQDSGFIPGQRFSGQIRTMLADLRTLKRRGDRMIVVTEQAPRLTQLWHEQDVSMYVPMMTDITTTLEPDALVFVNGTLSEGWTLEQDDHSTHLLTDAEIFGWNRPEPGRRRSARPRKLPESDYADWKEGDFVVHVDYGIGQFAGMRSRTIEGNEREYLLVQYAGTDMLFVPIHQADRLTRYIGADGSEPALNSLGKQEWAKVKNRIKKAVEEEAKELLELYAARAKAQGHSFAPDSHWQHELEASFPYVETEDQLISVRQIKVDMEAAQPMDRLICGDVGFGKTEVALRAAFKAVVDGQQVAVLVPTTVLAQQHYDTFSNRLAPFPVKVEMMSRFRTKEYQDRLLPKIASGDIDILIGTHRILSSDITFRSLGLVIIDEEQRFGVKQKEHFKALRKQIDVLTLTATPIPRTLYMSLTGVRDISMIQTPPEERLPVNTHVGRFDEHLIRQAVLREMERGGQVFVVHNRVKTIDGLRDRLEQIVPEARIIVGHGQMRERDLEKVMSAFAHGEYDILLSTSIIESGIDIPNANTLIVDHADLFGVAQLYQLRGRVGRSAQQAYAYLFHGRGLTPEARERLETLAENTSLGSGFQISMRDLEIRGAGDILSTRQTGHVAAIGLNLYTQLLQQSIQQLKGTPVAQTSMPVSTVGIVIDLPVAAYLPSDWIPDMSLRLQIYRRIAALDSLKNLEALRDELIDRFGQMPQAVEGLLFQIQVKLLAQQAHATHIMERDGQIQVKLPYLGEINREGLTWRLGKPFAVSRTAVSHPMKSGEDWHHQLIKLLQVLARAAEAVERTQSGL
jgi:transcription-repair coupling factor (superfamily II helicase)